MGKGKIINKTIGKEESCFIIAEAGTNHNGKLEQAKELIDIATEAGADAVKFQIFKADKLFNKASNKGIIDNLKKFELREEWYKELFDYANRKGIMFLASVFDEQTVDLLDDLGITAYKIGSYELTHLPLLEHVARKNKPIYLSIGMATIDEIYEAVECIYATDNRQLTLLHCVSQYPTDLENCNLNRLNVLSNLFSDCQLGFSDHTTTIYAPIVAVALGAKVIEKHFTIDKSLAGPDHKYALEPRELKQMIILIRETEKMLGYRLMTSNNIKPVTAELEERRWRRAIYTSQDIEKGMVITGDMLTILRPSPEGSVEPKNFNCVLGRIANKAMKKGQTLTNKGF